MDFAFGKDMNPRVRITRVRRRRNIRIMAHRRVSSRNLGEGVDAYILKAPVLQIGRS